jgi:hypothetical protein
VTPPDSLSYQTVFDVSRQLPQWWWGFVFPLAIVFVLMRFGARNRMNQHRWFKRIFVGFAVLLALLDLIFTWTQYVGQRNALEHGDVRIVEGVVNDFIPQSVYFKYPEQFVVVTPAGRCKYHYYSSLGTGGLNNSHGHIRNGTRVRITDRYGVILRLEVARDVSGNTVSPAQAERFPEVVFLPVVFARYGYTVAVPETRMAVRLIDVVSDTRICKDCHDYEGPGDAIAIIEVFDNDVGQEPFRLELHTNRERYRPFSDGDMVVDLTGLYPVPSVDQPTAKSDYRARLMFGRYKPALAEKQNLLEQVRGFFHQVGLWLRAPNMG